MSRLLDWAIVDSKGTADVLNLTTPDYPIVLAANKYVEKEFPKHCTGCSITTENVSAPDTAAGKGAGSGCRCDSQEPEDQVHPGAGRLLGDGLPQALKAAGIDAEDPGAGRQRDDAAGPAERLSTRAGHAVGAGHRLERGRHGGPLQRRHADRCEGARRGAGMDLDQGQLRPRARRRSTVPKGYQDQYKKLWKVTS